MKGRQYPTCKYARTASPAQQLKHVKSEVEEVSVALTDLLDDAVNNQGKVNPELVNDLVMEIHDLAHSAQTMLDIAARVYGVDVEAARLAVIRKNNARGYYD
jgi:hypothetical protein